MLFNIVIGNPPYNKGEDLPFIAMGHEVSKEFTVMITPAKWQTASPEYRAVKYSDFRKEYVPYMSHVCFYPTCKDIFDILQVDGITYFKIGKDIVDKAEVVNKCKYIPYFNSTEHRRIRERQSLLNIGNELVEYLGSYNSFKFIYHLYLGRYEVWTNTQVPGGGFSTLISPRKTLFIGESYINDRMVTTWPVTTASRCTFRSDNVEECSSFISWLNCKFIQFLLCINQSKLTGINTDDCFRFVPKPDKFDHIYTDKELYEKYNLPDKYIRVIEEVIQIRS
jgi:hypothetical protein